MAGTTTSTATSDAGPRPAEREDRWRRAARAIPAAVAAAYFAIGLAVLYLAHPQEDAYILFKYVENLAGGLGIVYYPGGPHAEGATDFLWLLLVTALDVVGFDVAVAALTWNALGAGLASALCVAAVARSEVRGPAAFALSACSSAVLVTGGSIASYVGFGAMLYSALALSLFCLYLWAGPRGLVRLPLLALALALFRADGAVPAAGFALLAGLEARREGVGRRYLASAAAAAAIALAYWLWRRAYFGLDLPLPLYVKGHGAARIDWSRVLVEPMSQLSGLSGHAAWASDPAGPRPLGLAILALALVVGRRGGPEARRLALGLLPYLAFLAALSFAQLSQNVAARLQSPVHLALLFGLVWWSVRAIEVRPRLRLLVVAIAAVALLPGVRGGVRLVERAVEPQSYVDTFAAELGAILPRQRVLALTEAGRLAFWTDARVEDVVGLNTARTALAPADLAWLAEVDPDLVMFIAGFSRLRHRIPPGSPPVVAIDAATIAGAIPEHVRPVFDDPPREYSHPLPSEIVAAAVIARFLTESADRYDLYAVEYNGGHNHVWAIRRGLPEGPAIVDALRRAASYQVYRSYAQIRGFPLAERVATGP